MATNVFINELHYDNDGTDTGEAIEIAGPAGIDLTGWSIVLYNGANGSAYDTRSLTSLAIPDQQNGFGTLSVNYPTNGIQNGSPDGIALVDNNNNVIQFLSYEGTFTAVGGPANGLASTDIGVSETASTPVGFSLQLTGTGSVYEDFTWSGPADDNFNSPNTGQTFGGSNAGVTITQSNGSTDVNEAGQTIDTYTISLNTTPAGSVTIAIAANDGQTQVSTDGTTFSNSVNVTLSDTNPQTITVRAVDDTITETSPHTGVITHTVTSSADPAYSNLSISNINVNITDNDVTPGAIRIYDIQGAAHTSPLLGQSVSNVPGIVTAVDSNGFYLQDPTGDGDIATSDGIFVFTSSRPTVSVGDSILVSGTVSEFTPGGASTGNLSVTQISGNPTINILSSGNSLPSAVILGAEGRTPPTQVIDNDQATQYNVLQGEGVYEPVTDGLDFYESLEGMRVTVNDALAVSPTNGFGEIFTVADNGANATGLSDRGTINIAPDDFNPERVQIQFDSGILPGFEQQVDVGAKLGDVTGVVGYNFGNFEVNVTETFTPVAASNLQPEVTNLMGRQEQLTVASYNVLNLDPNDADGDADVANGRFELIASQIVNNLKLPDIIGLQEVQDNDGSVNSNITAANETLQLLVNEIAEISGVTYEFIDNPFIGDDTSGGQPGGNIRTAFLYNPQRVSLAGEPLLDQPSLGSVQTVVDPQDQQTNPDNPFFNTRLPLVGYFTFNGQEVTVVNNHFSSKGGSSPLFGRLQPAADLQEDPQINGSVDERREQAQAVKNYVDNILANNSHANVVVQGDLNEFEFISPLNILEQSLTNLTETLPEDERYSFIFDGNSQALDHILVSGNLSDKAKYDIVHVNTEFAETDQSASDHDPILAQLNLAKNVINGKPGRDRLEGTAKADRITGFQGADILTGGAGADEFVYTRIRDTGDTITDFQPGTDKIVLTELFESLNLGSLDFATATSQGYLGFAAKGSNAQVLIDISGTPGTGRGVPLVTLEGVSVAALNDTNNFII
jgi:uncharacterized protein